VQRFDTEKAGSTGLVGRKGAIRGNIMMLVEAYGEYRISITLCGDAHRRFVY